LGGGSRASGWLLGAALAALGAALPCAPPAFASPPPAAGAEAGTAPSTDSLGGAVDLAAGAAPARQGAAAQLAAAWRDVAGDPLPERARRLRAAALQAGIWSLDPAARALLREATLGSALERAEAAALLAPELPEAHAALALARLRAGHPAAAFDAAVAALSTLDRHPEASFWLRASALDAASRAAIAGGVGFLLVAGLGAAAALVPALAVRLGLPSASIGAGLAALVLLPAAAGEGLLGVALACAALALARGGLVSLLAVPAAALVALGGLYPLAAAREAALAPFAADAVGAAAASAERDLASPAELARLARAAPHDRVARRALALHARRNGDVAEADARFRALLAEGDASSDVLNNAANARLAAGRAQEALELYEAAVRAAPSPLVLFNLAQAYGRAILLDEQDLALKQAQALDARAVHALTRLAAEVGSGGPVDVPLAADALRARAAERGAPPAPARAALAPGVLGGSPWAAGVALAAAAVLGLALRPPLRRLTAGEDLYAGLARLLQSRDVDPALRIARLSALRARQEQLERLRRLAAYAVPGAAGLQGGRALLGLAATLFAASAWALAGARTGPVPDPLAAGGAGALAFGGAAVLAALAYAAATALALALPRARS